jgi:alkylated DNA repair protein (DNA oxidative demethylase)
MWVQNHTQDLFQSKLEDRRREELASGAWLLHGFALDDDRSLLAAVELIQSHAPFRHLETPGGLRMSVAMTNCGSLGWVSDRRGYRYERCDPSSGNLWPAMPDGFLTLARAAALAGGFADFLPDACLINCYEPGTRLSLHQDRDECDFAHPIVSVSLGLPAVFLLGGDNRSERQRRIPLAHGDVVVFGGASRRRFHGVSPIKEGHHELVGARRLNLTFRRAR